jgi:hypothetical protein
LSATFPSAALDEVIVFNPGSRFEEEPEVKREGYLMTIATADRERELESAPTSTY